MEKLTESRITDSSMIRRRKSLLCEERKAVLYPW